MKLADAVARGWSNVADHEINKGLLQPSHCILGTRVVIEVLNRIGVDQVRALGRRSRRPVRGTRGTSSQSLTLTGSGS
jgi:hypothetical protein